MSEVSLSGAWIFSCGEACDQGKVREENQDTILSVTIPLGELILVADGIGGYQGGATASRMVADGFRQHLAAQPADYPSDAALQEACSYTNATIQKAALSGDPSLQQMGSTVVLALIHAEAAGLVAWIGHVGDSRAYLIRNGQMRKLTSDHSAVQALIDHNLITEEEALTHPDASILTRSLGNRSQIDFELNRVELETGDGLLLCSDGLWGYVADEDIAAVATDGELSAQTLADTLLHQALAAGGLDNIGIEFVRIESTAAHSPVAPFPLGATTVDTTPPDIAPTPTTRVCVRKIVVMVMLLLGCCGFLGYAAYNHGWQSAALPPALEKKLLIVGDLPGQDREMQQPSGTIHWQLIKITHASRPACANLGGTDPILYANPLKSTQELQREYPELGKIFNTLPSLPLTTEIRNACGIYDAILILPKRT